MHQAGSEQEEEVYGEVEIERRVKDDGRALILYERRGPGAEAGGGARARGRLAGAPGANDPELAEDRPA